MKHLVLCVVVVIGRAFCQEPKTPSFDVASVKRHLADVPFGPVTKSGGPGTDDPGQMTFTNVPLMGILTEAYDLEFYRIIGPESLISERYDIVAKIPLGATKEQVDLMLQKLLIERFHLTLHHEMKEKQAYDLVVANGLPKLKKTEMADAPGASGPLKWDSRGFPRLTRPGLAMTENAGPNGWGAHLTAKAQPLSALAIFFSRELRTPVADKTGLSGNYDFTLEYAPPRDQLPYETSLPGLPVAVEKQLGLKLEVKSTPLDTLVIDHVDRMPTDN